MLGAKLEIYRLVESLAQAGIAIRPISSAMPENLGLTDRIHVMAGGRIKGELVTAEASEQAILELAMAEPVTQAETR